MDTPVSNQPRSVPDKIRVALVGCGAAARELQMPVLAGHEHITVAALVDRDRARAQELADAYNVPRVLSDIQELDRALVDAAIICTPPFHHAPAAIDLSRRGFHVLVEKPMATSYSDAEDVVRVARESGVTLAVSVFRRLFPSTRMMRGLIDAKLVGAPESFDVEEGEVYSWPTATLGNMRRDLAGGGVLIDFGSHALDRLKFFFPGPATVLEYRDNASGDGVESDCALRLRMTTADGKAIEGRLELSRTRNLRNSFRVRCERGTLDLPSNDRFKVDVRLDGQPVLDPLTASPRSYSLAATWNGEDDSSWFEAFRAQIDGWVEAIRTGTEATLSGASVLPSFKLIEDAYRQRQPLAQPWGEETLQRAANVRVTGERRRVLITGATGFIGGRLAEVLSRRDGWNVRALVHNPSHASRLATLPVEMVVGDLETQEHASRLVEGCDAVVHCAIGTDWGNRKRIFDVTVGGTERLAQAALAHRVSRFIHVSTWAVHDLMRAARTIDETTPPDPPPGNDYAESKAEAERAISRAVEKGLCALTLRLTNVYGPFSTIFTTRPVSHLADGNLVLVGDGKHIPSSTVYIDSVVEAIVAGLNAPAEVVKGELLLVSDGDEMSWGDFYGYFADALHRPLREISDEEYRSGSPAPGNWLNTATLPLRSIRDLGRAPEVWALTKRVLKTEPIYSAGKWALNTFPPVERAVKRSLGIDTPVVYERSASAASPEPFLFELTRTRASVDKVRRVLGVQPAFTREHAMALTLDWLRYARIVPDAR